MTRPVEASPSQTTPQVTDMYTCLVIGRVFIVRWWGTPLHRHLDELYGQVELAHQRSAGKLYFLAIIPPGEGSPRAGLAREALHDFNARLMRLCEEIHLALLGRGIKNAIIRGIATLFRSSRIPISVHNSVHMALSEIERSMAEPTAPILRRLRELQLVD